MNRPQLVRSLLLVNAALILVAPGAGAFSLGDLTAGFQGADPSTVADGADLSGVLGKYQVTNVTGITALSVISWTDVEMFLRPTATQLEITMIPRGAEPGRAVQTTTINDTSSLKIVTTPFYTYFDGAQTTPPQLVPSDPQFDPGFITQHSTPDVSVANPIVLEDLRPRTITGPASMQTVAYSILSTGTVYSVPALTVLDVDDSVKLVGDPTTYDVDATITEATTKAAIETMLDPIALDGVDLNAVLNGLALSTQEIGVVNLAGLADSLATQGFTIKRIDDVSETARVEYVLDAKRIDFVNPGSIDHKVVLLGTDELANIDEGKIIALKDTEVPSTTRVLQHFEKTTTDVCLCMLIMEFDPDTGGITDLVSTIGDANKRFENVLVKILVRPTPSLLPEWTPEDLDLKSEGVALRQLVAGSTDQIEVEHIETLLLHKAVPPDPAGLMPRFFEDMYFNVNPDFDLPELQTEELLESIRINKDNLTDFTMLFCLKCINPDDQLALLSYLGQIESFVPRGGIALPEFYPPDVWGVVFGQNDQLVSMVGEQELSKQITEIYSTVRFRVITETTRLPVSGVTMTIRSSMPGWKGQSVQTFTVDTNQFGYAAVKMLPNIAYNFTAAKDGFVDYTGHGASPGPGETQGNDVRVTPKTGWQSLAEKAASPVFLFILAAAAVVGYVYVRKRGGFGKRRSR